MAFLIYLVYIIICSCLNISEGSNAFFFLHFRISKHLILLNLSKHEAEKGRPLIKSIQIIERIMQLNHLNTSSNNNLGRTYD